MKQILILTGDAGEGLEIYYAKFRLEEEGYTVHVAAPSRRVVRAVVHDFEPDLDTYVEKPGYRVAVDVAFDQVDPADYDALVLPGGRAPEYIRNRAKVQEIARHFFETNKPVAANCHGAQILMAAGVIGGRRLSCYPEIACDVEQAGGQFVNREVVVDGNLVSVRGWPDNGPWMREFVKLLEAVPAL